MHYLIIAQPDDEVALRVTVALERRHGAETVRLVTCEELVFAPGWVHRLGSGGVSTDIELADGTLLQSDGIGVVLNRLRGPDQAYFEQSDPADAEYAVMETYALLLSWLSGAGCPVVNAATPQGLSGANRSEFEWLACASRAGLPVRGYEISTDARRFFRHDYEARPLDPRVVGTAAVDDAGFAGRHPVLLLEPVEEPTTPLLVAGERVVGTVDPRWALALRRLAALAGTELLEVQVGRSCADGGGWVVCAATPEVRSTNDTVIGAIADHLEARAWEDEDAHEP